MNSRPNNSNPVSLQRGVQERSFWHSLLYNRARYKVDDITFYLKKKFFSSDLSVIFSTFGFYLGGCIIYWIFVVFPWKFIPILPIDFITVFLPLWTTICGFILTVLVALKINIQKAKTGEEFLGMLLYELSRSSRGDSIDIVTPNINIGQIAYPHKFINLERLLRDATSRGVKICFITLGVDFIHLKKYAQLTGTAPKRAFLYEGVNNGSPILTWFVNMYGSNVNDYELDKFVDFYLRISDTPNIEFKHCVLGFEDSYIVGYVSKESAFLGRYYPYDGSNRVSDPKVEGEIVNTAETIEIIKQFLVEKLIEEYKLRSDEVKTVKEDDAAAVLTVQDTSYRDGD